MPRQNAIEPNSIIADQLNPHLLKKISQTIITNVPGVENDNDSLIIICVVASTENILLDGTVTAIDTVNLIANDMVLIKNQSTASENGIYKVVTGSAWIKQVVAIGALATVKGGSQTGIWRCTNNNNYTFHFDAPLPDGSTVGDTISWDGSKWVISTGGTQTFPPPKTLVVSNSTSPPSPYYTSIQSAITAAYNGGLPIANLIMVCDTGTVYDEKITMQTGIDIMFLGKAMLSPTTDTTTTPVVSANNATCRIWGLNVNISHNANMLEINGSSSMVIDAGTLSTTSTSTGIKITDTASANIHALTIGGLTQLQSTVNSQITVDTIADVKMDTADALAEIDCKRIGNITVSNGQLDIEFDYAKDVIFVCTGGRLNIKGGFLHYTPDNGTIPVQNDATLRMDSVKVRRIVTGTACVHINTVSAVTVLSNCTLYTANGANSVTEQVAGCTLTNMGTHYNKPVSVTTVNVDTPVVSLNVVI